MSVLSGRTYAEFKLGYHLESARYGCQCDGQAKSFSRLPKHCGMTSKLNRITVSYLGFHIYYVAHQKSKNPFSQMLINEIKQNISKQFSFHCSGRNVE